MAKKKKISGIIVYILLALGLGLTLMAPQYPHLIETGYSTALYPWISGTLSRFTGLFSFSVAEILLLPIVAFCLYTAIRGLKALIKNPRHVIRTLPRFCAKVVLLLVLMYTGFNMLWGLNYSRLSFGEISGLHAEPSTKEELAALAESLVHHANRLRAQVKENDKGVMRLDTSPQQMLARADEGYKIAATVYPVLEGKYGPPKGVILSRYWSFTGTCGMYFVFTGEANVNMDIPPLLLPATTTHEMAHQRGFAREDEANYLAYLACSLHPDVDFQYSGTVSALIHTMNALYSADTEAYIEIRSQYCAGLNRDLQDWQEYWARFKGPVERMSSGLNDAYLKVNRQEDGIQSYGRMVDLLLAEFRQDKPGEP